MYTEGACVIERYSNFITLQLEAMIIGLNRNGITTPITECHIARPPVRYIRIFLYLQLSVTASDTIQYPALWTGRAMPFIGKVTPAQGKEFWDALDPDNSQQVLEAVKEAVSS